MTILIRPMHGADVSQWAVMRHALWADTPADAHAVEVEAALALGTLRGFVAETESGTSAGFAEISMRPYANGCTRTPVAFLEGIWVAESFRQTGVGGQLVDFISQLLIAEGHVELCSDALLENTLSHKTHAKWGFAEVERVVAFRKPLL